MAGDVVLIYLIGLCPALALSRRFEPALGLAAATVATAPLATFCAALLVDDLQQVLSILPLLVLVVLLAVYLVARVAARISHAVYRHIEPCVPLMTVNCVLLGIVLIALARGDGVVDTTLYALALSLGYGLLLVIFSHLRERLAGADVPLPFHGSPIALITLGIIALAISGFGVSSGF